MNHHNQTKELTTWFLKWDEPLQEFPDVPVFPPVPDPYASLTFFELAACDISPAHVSDDDDEEQADDNEEMEDDE
jgi:hypothetical protein